MRRIYGSDDLFPDSREHAYHAFETVNYIDCHDSLSSTVAITYRSASWGFFSVEHHGDSGFVKGLDHTFELEVLLIVTTGAILRVRREEV
jgi:hypothetical protein